MAERSVRMPGERGIRLGLATVATLAAVGLVTICLVIGAVLAWGAGQFLGA